MQLSELRTQLRSLIGNPTAVAVTDGMLTELLNEAQRDIGIRYRFYNSRKLVEFSTIPGTARYTLPSDLNVLMHVWCKTTNVELERKSSDQFIDESHQGAPTQFLRFKSWIELRPVPDKVYTIVLHYKTVIPDMVEDTDTPVIPVPWHHGLVRYARWLYYDSIGDIEKARYCLNTWNRWVEGQPVEVDEELFYSHGGVEIPTLAARRIERRNWDYE